MKVSAFLTDLNARIDNNATESDQLNWINKVEQILYRSNLMESSTAFITLVANQNNYSLSATPYKFEDIESLTIGGQVYDKRVAYITEENYTFYKSGTDLVLIPTPLTAVVNGAEIRYTRKPTIKTSVNKATEDLTIMADFGDEWLDIYTHYCNRQACITNREFEDANMYAQLYEENESAFWKWYVDHIPNDMAVRRKAGWR